MSTTADLREELNARRDQFLQDANKLCARARAENRDLADLEQKAVDECLAEARAAKQNLRLLPPDQPKVTKVKDRPIYGPGSEFSWFGDLVAARSVSPVPGNHAHHAQERLDRNQAQTRAHRNAMASVNSSRAAKLGAEFRDLSGQPLNYRDLSENLGSGGEFDPPLYLVDEFSNTVRGNAPLFACAKSVPLPPGCFELVIPEITAKTGAVVAGQNVPLPADDTTTSSVTGFVTAVVSETVVSYQALEQGNVDQWVAQASAEDIATQIESLIFTGNGEAEPTGILNAGASEVYYSGSTTTGLAESIAGAIIETSTNRLRYPEAVFANPAQLGWLLGYPDASTDVPLERLGSPVFKELGTDSPIVGSIAGLPLVSDGSIDVTKIYVGRPSDVIVAASEPSHRVLMDNYGQALAAVVQSIVYFTSLVRWQGLGWAYVAGLTQPA